MAEADRPVVGVVLAAGKGTRMKSARPKVLHPVAGRPMLDWVLDALAASGCERSLVVVGHAADEVRAAIAPRGVETVVQAEQLGTGHAVLQIARAVEEEAVLLVVSADVPLVTAETLARLTEASRSGWGAMAVARLERPGSLGRVIAGSDGELERIVEAADASPAELEVDLVNAGLYALPAPAIFRYLEGVGTDNAKGEIYLTDALGRAAAAGERLALVELDDPHEAQGVNDRRELARVGRRMVSLHLERLALSGVTVLDPARTTVEPSVDVGRDAVLHPEVSLAGGTTVGEGCELKQGVWVRDSRIGDGVVIEPYSVLDGATVEAGARIGPFARLRPGARIGVEAKVGNFVEVKNSTLGRGAKASHLAYLGDATVGDGANIGAGTITCNYDGEAKHQTEIGDGAFIGSDTMLVAPVRVGREATTGAGSVISRDVPDGALAVERSAQRTVEGWRERRARTRRRATERDADDSERGD